MIPLFKVFMSENAGVSLSKVLTSGYIGQGKKVEEFEEALRTFWGTKEQVLTTNSATSALSLAVRLCDIGPGDDVVSTPMTCLATNAPLFTCGANIIWSDVDPLTGLITAEEVEKVITPKTKAIVTVDYGGIPCSYDALRSFGVPIIEDAAHAIRTSYVECPLASIGGDYVCFSFQAIKHLTTGDGGALVVAESTHNYERAKKLRWYGFRRDVSDSFRCNQDIDEVGYKFHMNDINATIGLANLPHLDWIVDQHEEHAKFYCENIDNPKISVPPYVPQASYWIFIILIDERRESFIKYMAENGIAASQVHQRNDTYTVAKKFQKDLPGVDYFSSRQVAIPVGWWLDLQDCERIVEVVNAWR